MSSRLLDSGSIARTCLRCHYFRCTATPSDLGVTRPAVGATMSLSARQGLTNMTMTTRVLSVSVPVSDQDAALAPSRVNDGYRLCLEAAPPDGAGPDEDGPGPCAVDRPVRQQPNTPAGSPSACNTYQPAESLRLPVGLNRCSCPSAWIVSGAVMPVASMACAK